MKIEGVALFQFEVSRNGDIKSTTSKNKLGNQFLWVFQNAINTIPNYFLLSLRKMTSDSVFTLPVIFRLGNSSEYTNEDYLGIYLKPVVSRVTDGQRRKRITSHGEFVESGTEGTFYNLDEASKARTLVLGLSLVRKGMTEFPPQVQKMKSIKYIDLESNALTGVPYFVGELKKLEELYLYQNKIESTPASLPKLTKLRTLVLAENNINEFPIITDLKSLECLDLSNNRIEKIPSEIITLTNLRFLYLDNNNIKSIPEELYQLPNLKKLFIQGNPLSEGDIKIMKDRFKHIELVW